MANEKVLVADDEAEILELVVSALEKEGLKVTALDDGSKVISTLESGIFDLVILDLKLGEYHGFDILRTIRNTWPSLPVIILSGEKEDHNKAIGFELNADDYIEKPFSEIELRARVKRHIRRTKEFTTQETALSKSCMRFGNILFDTASGVLYKDDIPVSLSAQEYKILKFLMENPGQILSVARISEQCWEEDSDLTQISNSIRVYISKLRKYIEDNPSDPKILITAVGLGYKFEPRQINRA